MAIKLMITIKEGFGIIQKLLVAGLETNRGEERWFSVHAERSLRLETIAICIAVTVPL